MTKDLLECTSIVHGQSIHRLSHWAKECVQKKIQKLMLFQRQTLNTLLMSAISSIKFPSLPNQEKNKIVKGMPGMRQTAKK